MEGGAPRPFWREPMAWLVVALPLAVLVAAAVTIGVARRSPADASDGQVRRIAQIQIDDRAPDREAARRGLHARLQGDPARGRVEVRFDDARDDGDKRDGATGRAGNEVEATAGIGDTLALSMLHPLDERRDRHLSLRRDGTAWRATTAPWGAQAWELRLMPPTGDWRLAGRLAGEATAATLSPGVDR